MQFLMVSTISASETGAKFRRRHNIASAYCRCAIPLTWSPCFLKNKMQDGRERMISTTTEFPTSQRTINDREKRADQRDLIFTSASSELHFSTGLKFLHL